MPGKSLDTSFENSARVTMKAQSLSDLVKALGTYNLISYLMLLSRTWNIRHCCKRKSDVNTPYVGLASIPVKEGSGLISFTALIVSGWCFVMAAVYY